MVHPRLAWVAAPAAIAFMAAAEAEAAETHISQATSENPELAAAVVVGLLIHPVDTQVQEVVLADIWNASSVIPARRILTASDREAMAEQAGRAQARGTPEAQGPSKLSSLTPP
jgi:hypothetical protein